MKLLNFKPISKFFTSSEHALSNPDPKVLFSKLLADSKINIAPELPNLPLKLNSKDYLKIFSSHIHGSINSFNYNSSELTILGTQYESTPIKNIYKILSATKPDIVYLQIRPEVFLTNFRINPKEGGKFQKLTYLKQLVRSGREVMPNLKYYKKIENELKENNVFTTGELDLKIFGLNYKEFKARERIPNKTIATIAFFCEERNIPIVLCDMPDLVFRQSIANSLTLFQLQSILSSCSKEIVFHPDLSPINPMKMACLLYPEVFLEKSDKYIASLLDFSTRYTETPKKIVAFLGFGQNISVQHYLSLTDQKLIDINLEDTLISPPPNPPLFRDLTAEEILEKHSILDVMLYGKTIFKNIHNKEFKSTYKIIDVYADPEKVDSKRNKFLKTLHLDFLAKYHKLCKEKMREGKKELEMEFLKKAQV